MTNNFKNFYFKESKDLTIYIDLDGVLCDFVYQYKKYNSLHLDPDEYTNKFSRNQSYKMLEGFDKFFWSDMPWMNGGKDLWEYFKEYNPIILSRPINSEACHIGKLEWVRNNLGQDVKLILEQDKEKYANENSLLIDDRTDNIEKFIHNNGKGIVHVNTKQTIEKFEGLVFNIEKERS